MGGGSRFPPPRQKQKIRSRNRTFGDGVEQHPFFDETGPLGGRG
jgi:hypothetical protein